MGGKNAQRQNPCIYEFVVSPGYRHLALAKLASFIQHIRPTFKLSSDMNEHITYLTDIKLISTNINAIVVLSHVNHSYISRNSYLTSKCITANSRAG